MNRILKASLAFLALLFAVGCAGGSSEAVPAVPPAASLAFPVEILQGSGNSANRINLAVLGDGYTAHDQAKLTRDAQAWLAAFQRTPPYGNYAAYFNVKLVHVVSREDGADNGMHGLGVARDTALGAAFRNASPAGQAPDYRLLVVDSALVLAVAAANVPECAKVLVIVNDTKYGGSGGAITAFSAHADSGLIALHEFGHSFGGLADEYSCGDTSALPASIEAFPNVTTRTEPDQIKWKDWIEPGMPLPTPDIWAHASHLGLFEGAYYRDGGVFRPRHACRMRSLDDAFCEVCAEAIVRGVYARVAPIDAALPASPVPLEAGASVELSLAHPMPNPSTLRVTWTMDGAAVAGNGNRFTLQGAGLKPGLHEITAHLVDATPLVRNGRERLEKAHTWIVNSAGAPAPVPAVAPPQERAKHQLLRVIRDAEGFRVVDRQILELPLPPEPNLGHSAWQIDLLGTEGQILFRQGIEDPTLLRGEFRNAGDPGRIDGYRLDGKGPVAFLLRMPVMEANRLEIFKGGGEGPRTRLGGASLRGEPIP